MAIKLKMLVKQGLTVHNTALDKIDIQTDRKTESKKRREGQDLS